jgi:hypothetical protein
MRDLADFYNHCIDNNNKPGFSLDSSKNNSNSNNTNNGFVPYNPTSDDEEYRDWGRHQLGPQQQKQHCTNTKPYEQNPVSETAIPFVSQFSNYMEQLKKEIIMLKADKQSTTREIDGLQLKLDKAEDNLRQTV